MADSVYIKMKRWYLGYETNGEPHKPRAVPHPQYGADQPILIVPAYTHKVPLRLNELSWLEQVLDYATQHLADDDPKRVVYGVIKLAREQHEKLQDNKRIAIGTEYSQPYLFDKTHVQWIFNTLGQHSMGRLISEADNKKVSEDIAKADW